MGVFCMVFGVVIFVAFLFTGYLLASAWVMEGLLNVLAGATVNMSEFFRLPTAENAGTYIVCILLMGFIGLMIGLGVFMNGMIYNRMNKLDSSVRRLRRMSKQKAEE